MLTEIVDLIKQSNQRKEGGTLFCDNYIIKDISIIENLESINAFENVIFDKSIGAEVNLELSLAHLSSIGYFDDCEAFIIKNKYCIPNSLFYIHEIKCYSTESQEFIIKYKSIINLINAIKKTAKHTYTDIDIDKSFLFREDRSLFLPYIYDVISINIIKKDEVESLNLISQVLDEESSEKKILFINELIDFLITKDENDRFKFLLSRIIYFRDKCNNAYQFYLRDYSHNKLKIELDSKALEYTQKIQSVINDSQTKLIAIPTAFILVFVAFDFTDLFAIKNIVSILSLFIFATLIQLFLNNQKSTLRFIWENILSYKETFSNTSIETISNKFILVEKELKKQKKRLRIVEILLWSIPVILILLWLLLISYKTVLFGISILLVIITKILKTII